MKEGWYRSLGNQARPVYYWLSFYFFLYTLYKKRIWDDLQSNRQFKIKIKWRFWGWRWRKENEHMPNLACVLWAWVCILNLAPAWLSWLIWVGWAQGSSCSYLATWHFWQDFYSNIIDLNWIFPSLLGTSIATLQEAGCLG